MSAKKPGTGLLDPSYLVCATTVTGSKGRSLSLEPCYLYIRPGAGHRPRGMVLLPQWGAGPFAPAEGSAGQPRRQFEPGDVLVRPCSLILPCIYPKAQCFSFSLH